MLLEAFKSKTPNLVNNFVRFRIDLHFLQKRGKSFAIFLSRDPM